ATPPRSARAAFPGRSATAAASSATAPPTRAVTCERSLASRADQDFEGFAPAHQVERHGHVRESHAWGDRRRGGERAGGEQRDGPPDQRRGVMEGPQESQLLVVDPAGIEPD